MASEEKGGLRQQGGGTAQNATNSQCSYWKLSSFSSKRDCQVLFVYADFQSRTVVVLALYSFLLVLGVTVS